MRCQACQDLLQLESRYLPQTGIRVCLHPCLQSLWVWGSPQTSRVSKVKASIRSSVGVISLVYTLCRTQLEQSGVGLYAGPRLQSHCLLLLMLSLTTLRPCAPSRPIQTSFTGNHTSRYGYLCLSTCSTYAGGNWNMSLRPSAWAKQPSHAAWSMECLIVECSIILGCALDALTQSVYSSALNSYLTFCQLHHLNSSPTANTLSVCISFMSHHIQPCSVHSYLAGIVS